MIIYGVIGLFAGIVSGMGIGGGTVLIPALVIFMGMAQTEAQSINLIYFIPTAIAALVIHIKNKAVEKKVVFWLILFGLAAAAAGSFIAVRLQGDFLRRIFGCFLLVMGIMEFRKKGEAK